MQKLISQGYNSSFLGDVHDLARDQQMAVFYVSFDHFL